MTSYYERYIAGEYEQVWDELVALDAAVREEPLYADALAVAVAAMIRTRYNVELLISKLNKIGYLFQWGSEFSPANENDILLLEEREKEVGPVPLSVKACIELVGSFYLDGRHPNWPMTPRTYLSIEIILQRYGAIYNGRTIGIHVIMDDSLMAGDATGPSEIVAPYAGADGFFRNPEKNIAPTFIQYLRRSFAWGGFPGFAEVEELLRPTEMLEYLKDGLLPI